MDTDCTPIRFRRGFCIDAAAAFAEAVALRAATTNIDRAMAATHRHFSTVDYNVDWNATEKYAWLFVVALDDADDARRAYWLEYVRCRVARHLNQKQVKVA
jgi:hypothetical protein